jgi:hypothetical protein
MERKLQRQAQREEAAAMSVMGARTQALRLQVSILKRINPLYTVIWGAHTGAALAGNSRKSVS